MTAHCLKVQQLEAYLGGEIPELMDGKQERTWKEEREFLYSEIQVGVSWDVVSGIERVNGTCLVPRPYSH